MNITLHMLTDDPEIASLASRYWAADQDGRFLERVRDLLPFRDLRQAAQLTQFLREHCRVLDENQRCPRCQAAIAITSRSAVQPSLVRAHRPCDACAAKLAHAMLEARAREERALAEKLQAYMQAQPAQVTSYGALADDSALLLMALDAALAPRLGAGEFRATECHGLVAAHAPQFLERLRQAGVLREEPMKASDGTYFLEHGSLMARPSAKVYSLAPALDGEGLVSMVRPQQGRLFDDAPRLYDLWLDYSVADCMAYFEMQAALYAHEVFDEERAEVCSILRAGLEHYCVAQLWSLIWRVVRDAASLSRHTFYNRAKAAATIPGKLRRALERARREALEVRCWRRPEQQPAGTLGMVFEDLFGLSENSAGSLAWAAFSHRSEAWAGSATEPANGAMARRLMIRALGADQALASIERLSEALASGMPLEHALAQVLQSLPDTASLPG
ncbi:MULTISPECIES: hypothetical protein [unclassified Pseudomonas]|uniref:hypothetical protein n=1 Tax=unclassified Pseudomonas TaxID=196821 RepID=UPI000BC51A54|nr:MULTISPECIES: hypothetical protein [unclassified Pseudomonas]PVZ11472.1 hypothetical protein F474_03800 [Pseudomonas sp. URIL14HWK12:I12]PVZ22470.1 hypothetical protein F470_03800 [Pseudomonas sp. URIL14HWK12:I10]PVZ31406.1 hypothetical protein F472_03571 [Pseudomonas sp. URIL14HWK12:I11]SNZ16183.1 hypothetical protein SAMN05660463_03210 [Pseudomonas sp. URIL14HWK12:I9]